MKKTLVALAVAALTLSGGSAMAQKKQLVIVVKGLDNPFFEAIHQGCEKWNKENASSPYNCFYTGPASTSDEAGEAQIVGDILVISGEKEVAEEDERGDVRRTEIRYGQFYRAIPLPDGVKTQEARAQFQKGVLQITLPLEQANVHQIPVQADSSSQSATRIQPSGQDTQKPSAPVQKEKVA